MRRTRRRKCLSCGELFRVDPRNRSRQKYCAKQACRRASKDASQRRWLAKPENQDYFRDPAHLERVRQWRSLHPGYWRRGGNALQGIFLPPREMHYEDRYKRLRGGKFVWPKAESGTVSLSAAQLSMLLDGIDWRQPKRTALAPQDPDRVQPSRSV